MADPKRLRAVWDTDHKNDVQDADELSDLLRVNRFPRAYVPTPALLRMRSVLRARIDLGVEGTRAENRIHALLDGNGVKAPYSKKKLFEAKGLAWLKRPRWNDERDTIIPTLVMQLESTEERRSVLDEQLVKVAADSPAARHIMTTTGIDCYDPRLDEGSRLGTKVT
jgi:transposase